MTLCENPSNEQPPIGVSIYAMKNTQTGSPTLTPSSSPIPDLFLTPKKCKPGKTESHRPGCQAVDTKASNNASNLEVHAQDQ